MIRYLLILSSTIFLVGCSTCPSVPAPPKIDSYLMSVCDIPEKVDKFTSIESILVQKAREATLYKECMLKHEGLIKAIDKYKEEFNAIK